MTTDNTTEQLLAAIAQLRQEVEQLQGKILKHQKAEEHAWKDFLSRTVPSQHEIDSIRETITAWQNEKDNLQNGVWNLTPGRATNHGWDQLVDPWIEFFPTIGDKIPSAYRIWQSAHRYYKAGDKDRADRCERLNYILHNSYIPAALQLRGEVTFAYGGIGVILHQDADIFPHVTIEANTTIGGNGSQVRIDERTGRKTTVPLIGTLSTIGAGANITGGIEIGPLSIIAPNTVVTKSHPAGSILAGAPARPIAQITLENCLRYKAKFLPARSWSNEQFIDFAKNHLV